MSKNFQCLIILNVLQVLKYVEPGKHKHFLATFYAPLVHSHCALKIADPATAAIAARGHLKNHDADAILYQRKQLHGRVKKASAKNVVVRGMFHSPEDVAWFSPVALITGSARVGRIHTSLGTHGAMKCKFERAPKSGSVYMNLYKRVFPRWAYSRVDWV